MDHETILKLLVVLNEKCEHHFAKLVSNTAWEVIQKAEKILETNKLRKVFGSHHDFYEKILKLHVETVIRLC